MRILSIRLKNLNSLVGEWQLDLTAAAYSSEGIFAITGPTGAGKSTLLDALSLALYGQTPRLGRITSSDNEVMSRQTGECFAEVTFATTKGQFRCHWGQHRARKSPDGALQNAGHELSELDTGKILCKSLKEVPKAVEEVTGMDFERFTRSMLLAQGGFAAFLKAAPNERAPILEQITGTDIYSQISIRVHERFTQEKQQLQSLLDELAGMKMLSSEEVEQKTQALTQQQKAAENQQQQIKISQQALGWLEGLERLHQEQQVLQQQAAQLAQQQADFAPQEQRLQQASQALELAADGAELKAQRNAIAQNRARLQQVQGALPATQNRVQQSTAQLHQAKTEQQQAQQQLEDSQPLLQQVRALDTRLQALQEPLQRTLARLIEHQQKQTQQHSLLTQLEQQKNQRLERLNELEGLLQHSAMDAELTSQLQGLKQRFSSLRQDQQLQADYHHQLNNLQADRARLQQELQHHQQHQAQHQADLQHQHLLLQQNENNRLQLLQNQSLPDLRQQERELAERLKAMQQLLERLHSHQGYQQQLAQLQAQQTQLLAEVAESQQALEQLQTQQQSKTETRDLLEQQQMLLSRIASLEEARQQLQPDEACPLCGATEHPFVEHRPPSPDESSQRLLQLREELHQLQQQHQRLHQQNARQQADYQAAARRRAELEAEQQQLLRQISPLTQQLQLPDAFDPLNNLLPGLIQTNQQQQTQLSQRLLQLEQLQETREQLLQQQQAAADQIQQDQNTQAQMEARIKALRDKHQWLQEQLEPLQNRLLASTQALEQALLPYGLSLNSGQGVEQLQSTLQQRLDLWQKRQQEHTEQQHQLQQLQHQQISPALEQLKHLDASITLLLAEQQQLQDQQQQLLTARAQLFGDQQPDELEQKLKNQLNACTRQLDIASQQLREAETQLQQLTTQERTLQQALQEQGEKLQQTQDVFNRQLQALGFDDEATWQAACLPEAERKALAEQQQALQKRQIELQSRQRHNQQTLEAEQSKQLTTETLPALQQQLQEQQQVYQQLLDTLGGLKQELKANENLRLQQQQRLLAIAKQQQERDRWQLLHSLIGSADGKKFRNFAQGLTFELLVRHANQQLSKMTDRYLLERDAQEPLELQVLDNYQAGELRSTKNLSGGESFIVSLALALGLSYMASDRVRVDSLFLDEGFGTLDEEALDTALETLAGLQQEGKLIGVISHVPALKERISTRIQVIPQTGGRSILLGSGITGK